MTSRMFPVFVVVVFICNTRATTADFISLKYGDSCNNLYLADPDVLFQSCVSLGRSASIKFIGCDTDNSMYMLMYPTSTSCTGPALDFSFNPLAYGECQRFDSPFSTAWVVTYSCSSLGSARSKLPPTLLEATPSPQPWALVESNLKPSCTPASRSSSSNSSKMAYVTRTSCQAYADAYFTSIPSMVGTPVFTYSSNTCDVYTCVFPQNSTFQTATGVDMHAPSWMWDRCSAHLHCNGRGQPTSVYPPCTCTCRNPYATPNCAYPISAASISSVLLQYQCNTNTASNGISTLLVMNRTSTLLSSYPAVSVAVQNVGVGGLLFNMDVKLTFRAASVSEVTATAAYEYLLSSGDQWNAFFATALRNDCTFRTSFVDQKSYVNKVSYEVPNLQAVNFADEKGLYLGLGIGFLVGGFVYACGAIGLVLTCAARFPINKCELLLFYIFVVMLHIAIVGFVNYGKLVEFDANNVNYVIFREYRDAGCGSSGVAPYPYRVMAVPASSGCVEVHPFGNKLLTPLWIDATCQSPKYYFSEYSFNSKGVKVWDNYTRTWTWTVHKTGASGSQCQSRETWTALSEQCVRTEHILETASTSQQQESFYMTAECKMTRNIKDLLQSELSRFPPRLVYDESSTVRASQPPVVFPSSGHYLRNDVLSSQNVAVNPIILAGTDTLQAVEMRSSSTAATPVNRYHTMYGVLGSDFDIGKVIAEEGGITLSFWLNVRLQPTGFLFALTDTWIDKANGGQSVVLQHLQTIFTSPENDPADYFVDDWNVYAALYLDRERRELRLVTAKPKASNPYPIETVTWKENTNIKSLFDGSWHHVMITHDGKQVQIYVDGVTQFRLDDWLQCVNRGIDPIRTITAGSEQRVLNTLREAVYTGGMMVVADTLANMTILATAFPKEKALGLYQAGVSGFFDKSGSSNSTTSSALGGDDADSYYAFACGMFGISGFIVLLSIVEVVLFKLKNKEEGKVEELPSVDGDAKKIGVSLDDINFRIEASISLRLMLLSKLQWKFQMFLVLPAVLYSIQGISLYLEAWKWPRFYIIRFSWFNVLSLNWFNATVPLSIIPLAQFILVVFFLFACIYFGAPETLKFAMAVFRLQRGLPDDGNYGDEESRRRVRMNQEIEDRNRANDEERRKRANESVFTTMGRVLNATAQATINGVSNAMQSGSVGGFFSGAANTWNAQIVIPENVTDRATFEKVVEITVWPKPTYTMTLNKAKLSQEQIDDLDNEIESLVKRHADKGTLRVGSQAYELVPRDDNDGRILITQGGQPVDIQITSQCSQCPLHNTPLIEASDGINMMKSSSTKNYVYTCCHRHVFSFHRQKGCTRDGIYYCSTPACGYAICKNCWSPSLSATVATKIRGFLKRFKGFKPLIALIVITICNIVFQPVMRTALMVLSRYQSFKCVSYGYENVTADAVSLTFASFICIWFLGVYPLWLSYVILYTKYMISCAKLFAETRIKSLIGTRVDPAAWTSFLANDDSFTKPIYEQFLYERILMGTLFLLFAKIAVLLSVILPEPESVTQLNSAGSIECVFGVLLTILSPFVNPFIDFLYRIGSIHQLCLLAFHALYRRALITQNANNDANTVEFYESCMVAVTIVYFGIVFGSALFVVLYPKIVSWYKCRQITKPNESAKLRYAEIKREAL